MSFRKFGPNDVVRNTLKAHPKSKFFIYQSNIYYNDRPQQSGSFSAARVSLSEPSDVLSSPTGHISLYEYNVDRAGPDVASGPNPRIYPYITKDSARASFKTSGEVVDSSTYANEFEFGDVLNGTYPQTASIRRDYITDPYDIASGTYNQYYMALRNLLNLYGVRSRHYLVTSSYGDKNVQTLNLIHIPSIFYGQQIKPGSISLKWYYTGSLAGELRDIKQNGELIQVSGTHDDNAVHGANIGNVAGVALYDEGFLLMTGSWALNGEQIHLRTSATGDEPKWIYFGAGALDGAFENTVNDGAGSTTFRNAAFELSFEGTTKTQTVIMYTHAKRGEVNYSNNPTFIKYGQEQLEQTSSHIYEENSKRLMKNTVSSSYSNFSASFKRQVYISKIAVYDNAKNLIGIATLASPTLKEEDQDYTFKIKLDI